MVGTGYSYVPLNVSKNVQLHRKRRPLIGPIKFILLISFLPFIFLAWTLDKAGFADF